MKLVFIETFSLGKELVYFMVYIKIIPWDTKIKSIEIAQEINKKRKEESSCLKSDRNYLKKKFLKQINTFVYGAEEVNGMWEKSMMSITMCFTTWNETLYTFFCLWIKHKNSMI